MTKPLSLDLRRRIIRAVEEEGMSRRAAAARFGVAPSTAVELVRQWKATGSCEACPQGGDRRSARIEAHSAQLLALVKSKPDITLEEIARSLHQDGAAAWPRTTGERCVAPVPHGHWQTTAFVGALRATGMAAPMLLDGTMDGAGSMYLT